jgi:hypothetical protein
VERRSVRLLAAGLVAALCGGCGAVGPASIKAARLDYNIAIQGTDIGQLLLNVVRLRYREPPYFLEVASVSSSLDAGATATGTVPSPLTNMNPAMVEAGLVYSEKPTVTYSPLQGRQFATQLMTPLDLNTLVLLCNSGWSIKRVFLVGLQAMNRLANAPRASGPTPRRAPEYEAFRDAVELLEILQSRDAIQIGPVVADGQSRVEFRIAEQASGWEETKRLKALLGLRPDLMRFWVTTEVGPGGGDHIDVVPRH